MVTLADVLNSVGTFSDALGLGRPRSDRGQSSRVPLRIMVVGVVVAVGVSGCGGGRAPESGSAGLCEGRAEFWGTIQQDYLDRLGDAPADDLDPPSDPVFDAGKWLGTAMVEFVREADSVGCAAEVRAGSALICARVERLEPRGGAGEIVVGQHMDACRQ